MDVVSIATRLSLVTIDVDKDWASHLIKNLGAPVDVNDALRKAELDTHKTASPLDHPDASVTTAKIADRAVTIPKISPALWALVILGL